VYRIVPYFVPMCNRKYTDAEAPVCLVSMTASSGEEMPRGMEFLLSRERINVAVSRAKALALVFAAPCLLAAKGASVEQMALVNLLCALAEQGRTETPNEMEGIISCK
jgi:hypothetical protein